MSWNKSNLVLGVACAALAVPTLLQLSAEAESFVDVGRIPLMFDGFTADNVGSVILGDPRDEQPEPKPDGRASATAHSRERNMSMESGGGPWLLSSGPSGDRLSRGWANSSPRARAASQ